MQFFKQDLSVRDLSNLRLSWGWKFIEQLVIATIILIGFNSIAWAQRRPIADETLGNERSIGTLLINTSC